LQGFIGESCVPAGNQLGLRKLKRRGVTTEVKQVGKRASYRAQQITNVAGLRGDERRIFWSAKKNRTNAVFLWNPVSSGVDSMVQRAGLGQPFGVVITRGRGRNSRGFAQAARIFGMGDSRSRRAMAAIAVALTAVVVPAFAMVADSLAGVVAGQTFTVAVAGRAAGVTCTTVAAADPAAMAATVSGTITAAVTATVSTATAITTATATATAVFGVGGTHEGHAIRQQRGSCQHQGARHNCNETLVF
jgi:hypothetical protein